MYGPLNQNIFFWLGVYSLTVLLHLAHLAKSFAQANVTKNFSLRPANLGVYFLEAHVCTNFCSCKPEIIRLFHPSRTYRSGRAFCYLTDSTLFVSVDLRTLQKRLISVMTTLRVLTVQKQSRVDFKIKIKTFIEYIQRNNTVKK